MALEYFPCYHSYLDGTSSLSDSELGRLFRALMRYSATGEPQQLKGREHTAYDFIVHDIDRARNHYNEVSKNRSGNHRAKVSNDSKESKDSTRSKGSIESIESKAPKSNSESKSDSDSNGLSPILETTTTTTAGAGVRACEGGNPAFAEVVGHYEKCIGTIAGTQAAYALASYSGQLPAEVIKHAIDTAMLENKYHWSYVESILRDYVKNGVSSLEDVQRKDAEWRERKERGGDRGSARNPQTVQKSGKFAQFNESRY